MIVIKTASQIDKTIKAGMIISDVFGAFKKKCKKGTTTLQLNKMAEDYILSKNAYPCFKGYRGYKHAICASVNNVVLHGVPNNKPLKDGDIVSLDVGVNYLGLCADAAITLAIGEKNNRIENIITIAKTALKHGIEETIENNNISDISKAIYGVIRKSKYNAIESFCGHGIGMYPHEEPIIPNTNLKTKNPKIKNGMILAVEPIICEGSTKYTVDKNGWSKKIEQGFISAHEETTIIVNGSNPIVVV